MVSLSLDDDGYTLHRSRGDSRPRLSDRAKFCYLSLRPGQPRAAVPTWFALASSRLIWRCPSRFPTFGAGLRRAPSASCWWWRGCISTPVTRVENALKEVPAKIGIEIQQSAKGFTVSRSEQGHTIFKIEASKAVQYKQGGRAELHDVTITLYGRDSSRFDQIYGADFEYDPQSGDVIGKGQVQMDLEANPEGIIHPDQATPRELKNPVHLTTTNLLFNQKTGNAITREKVEFSLPQANGSAVGLSYAADTTVLTLQSQVDVAFHGATPATPDRDSWHHHQKSAGGGAGPPAPAERRAPRFRGQRHDLPASGQHRGPHSRQRQRSGRVRGFRVSESSVQPGGIAHGGEAGHICGPPRFRAMSAWRIRVRSPCKGAPGGWS